MKVNKKLTSFCLTIRFLLLFRSLYHPNPSIMFVRPVSKRAARIAQTLPSCSSSSRAIGGVRLASSQIPTKAPPHRVAGGQNSMLVGSAVLGATLLLGYVFGRGDNVEHAAKSTIGEYGLRCSDPCELTCINDE